MRVDEAELARGRREAGVAERRLEGRRVRAVGRVVFEYNHLDGAIAQQFARVVAHERVEAALAVGNDRVELERRERLDGRVRRQLRVIG